MSLIEHLQTIRTGRDKIPATIHRGYVVSPMTSLLCFPFFDRSVLGLGKGLLLWPYQGGPWELAGEFEFTNAD